MDNRDSENNMIKLDIIYDNDRKYVAKEIEEGSNKSSKVWHEKVKSDFIKMEVINVSTKFIFSAKR